MFYDRLPQFTFKNISTGATIKSSQLFQRPTVLLAVRRPGCSLCREQATRLQLLRDQFQRLGIQLVAIVKEELGAMEFKQQFWPDEVYLDESMDVYKYIHGGKPYSFGILDLLSFSALNALKRAAKAGIKGNIIGEGFKTGGLMVVDSNGYCIYKYAETNLGELFPLEQVVDACQRFATQDAMSPLKETLATKLGNRLACNETVCAL